MCTAYLSCVPHALLSWSALSCAGHALLAGEFLYFASHTLLAAETLSFADHTLLVAKALYFANHTLLAAKTLSFVGNTLPTAKAIFFVTQTVLGAEIHSYLFIFLDTTIVLECEILLLVASAALFIIKSLQYFVAFLELDGRTTEDVVDFFLAVVEARPRVPAAEPHPCS